MPENVLLTGAAGFIGSHLADSLLERGCAVTGIDNFVRGRRENLKPALQSGNFRLIDADLADLNAYRSALAQGKTQFHEVWHLAANSDIAAGVKDPSVDHRDTFLTTFNT